MASFKEKLGYALGDAAAGGIAWKIMSIAFPLYFTNVFGLSLVDTATLMLIARLFDVVTDPLMGSIADRTQSRWGTYRPWLIFGSIPFGLVFALLLFTPDLGPGGNRVYAYVLYLLMMAVYTMVNVPYGSLLGVMTANDDEKNRFSSYRMVGAYAMGFITLLAFPYIQKFICDDSAVLAQIAELNKEGVADETQKALLGELQLQLQAIQQVQYRWIGIGFGLLAALMTLACGLMTKERLKPVRAEKFKFRQYIDLFRNRPWICLTLIGICMNFFNGFRYAVAGYMFEYCLNGEVTVSGFIINFTSFMAFGEVTCMVFGGVSPWFTRKMGSKRKAFIAAALICAVTSMLFFFVPMDASWIWVMVLLVILTSVGIGLFSPLVWSMYADVADYATEKNGTSSTGLIFSSGTMSQKLGSAVSGSLVVMFLGWSGATMIADDMGNKTIDQNSITPAVQNMVWMLFSLIPAVMALVLAWLAYIFPLKK